MARRKRRYDAQSVLRYVAKTEKLYRANTKDEALAHAQASLASYNWIAGQGGYVGVRQVTTEILDELGIPKAVRLPFFAIAQKVAKLIVAREITNEGQFDEIVDTLIAKHFVEGSELYDTASTEFKTKLKEALLFGTYKPAGYKPAITPT